MDAEQKKTASSPKSKGARLSYLIEMSGLSLVDLAEQLSVGYSSLRQWRTGKRNLTGKQAYNIINFMKSKDIICAHQWLMDGEGELPYYSDPGKNIEPAKIVQSDIEKEILFFKENNTNSVVFEIKDDTMLPAFKSGTILGGICLNRDKIRRASKKICIVESKDHGVFCRLVQKIYNTDLYLFSPINLSASDHSGLTIKEKRILKIAPVSRMWINYKID